MKLSNPLPLSYFNQFADVQIICNNSPAFITGINEIHKVGDGDITFVDHPKYYERVLKSKASFIIINKEFECPDGKALIVCNNPYEVYNRLALEHRPFEPSYKQIADTAQIGEGTVIQPNVFIGNHVVIGKNCIIHANVSIYDHSILGDNVIIHANTVIGSDAFYYKTQNGKYCKMHSIGRALIEDEVEIGACCTITAGVSGDTIIGAGTKIDNHVHIAHGVVVGKNCLFAAQVAIAGKSTIGNNVILYGKVGIGKGITIGDGAVLLASSNADKNLEGGKTYFGSPADDPRTKWKEMAALKQLPDFIKNNNGKL